MGNERQARQEILDTVSTPIIRCRTGSSILDGIGDGTVSGNDG